MAIYLWTLMDLLNAAEGSELMQLLLSVSITYRSSCPDISCLPVNRSTHMGIYLWTLAGMLRSAGLSGYARDVEKLNGDKLSKTLWLISTWLRNDCPDRADFADIILRERCTQ